MPFSFPASPSVGQQSTQNGRTYSWSGSAWELVAASGGGTDSRWDLFLPPAPTSVTPTGGNGQATVSWSAPTVSAQTPITNYIVQFSSNSGSTWTTFTRAASTATSAIVTSLTNGTAYVFRVAAVNGVGTGSYSDATSSITLFPPSSISGLQGWYDASDASTLYDATSGGSVVAVDGAVARWQDKSGNGNHVTQSDSSARPLARASIANGLAAVEFDGTSDFLAASGSVMPTGSAARTMIAVYRPLRTTGVNAVAGVGSSGGSGLWFRIQFRDSPAGDPYFAGFAADLTDSTGIAQTIKVASITYNGTTGVLYRNGSQIASSSLSLNTGSNPFTLGGDGPSGSEYSKCYLCEVLVYNSALSNTDRAAAESYLMTRWGIS